MSHLTRARTSLGFESDFSKGFDYYYNTQTIGSLQRLMLSIAVAAGNGC